jgi:DNA-binding winged helix-turn-helix (wHTH) protein
MVLVFGDHRLDLKRRELRRGGELVAIEPRAFDLLAFLVRRRDRVVTKDDLLQGVWGGRPDRLGFGADHADQRGASGARR